MSEFDADTAMTVGGYHPRYARVLDVQVDGDVAAALVDANGTERTLVWTSTNVCPVGSGHAL